MVERDDMPEHFSDQEALVSEAGGTAGYSQSPYNHTMPAKFGRRGRPPKKRISTQGRIRSKDGRAWVYVATNSRGQVKIGMTGDPEKRAVQLCASMRMCLEVHIDAAQVTETVALRHLGHEQGDSEWTHAPLEKALAAVWRARNDVAAMMRCEPSLSEDDARLLRLGLANLK